MISARGGRTDITNILLEGEHIDLDIQENVSVHVRLHLIWKCVVTAIYIGHRNVDDILPAA